MRKHTRQRRGFTMAECMIAIGILGVGMAMVGVLFPAAVKESKSSSGNVVGEMIAQNGLAMVPLTHKSELESLGGALTPVTTGTYPSDNADSLYGYVALGKNVSSNPTICELLIIAYRKQDKDTKIEWGLDKDGKQAVVEYETEGGEKLLVSPEIFRLTGRVCLTGTSSGDSGGGDG